MKYLILLLLILNISIARANLCASLYTNNRPSEAELNKAIIELHALKATSYSNNKRESLIAQSLFNKKLNELQVYISKSEIQKRLRSVGNDSSSNKNLSVIHTNSRTLSEVARVQDFLNENWINDYRDILPNGDTTLHIAALQNRIDVVQALINLGLNPNATNKRQETPLHFAYKPEIIDFLFSQGAQLEARSDIGYTPLLRAISKVDVDSVNKLLDLGANANTQDNAGYTALVSTIFLDKDKHANDSKNIFDLLRAKGATHDLTGDHRYSFLSFAIENSILDIIDFFIQNKDIDVQTGNNENLIHLAVRASSEAVLKKLLNTNLDINLRDSTGLTPLHWAASRGNLNIIQLLIDNKADLNISDEYGNTVLKTAKSSGRPQVVNLLIKAGAKE